jgi:anaerobic dimethyl sulfoxide reductase subunit C (anchor subunit)
VNRESNWPLVGFTALSPLAIGGLAGLLLVRGRPGIGVDPGAVAVLAIALLALIASALHLGRPLRAYRSIARLTTSWLSREVVLFGIFVLLMAAYALPLRPSGWGERQGVLGILAIAAGALSLFATGEVYCLPSRPTWNTWRTVASLVLGALGAGLPFGACMAQLGLSGPGGLPVAVAAISAAALLLGMAVTCFRLRRPDPGQMEEFGAWQVMIGPCRWLLALRLAGALCATGLLFAAAPLPIFAWIPAAIAEMADRALFFRAVVPVSMARRAGILPFEPVAVVDGATPRGREAA